MRIFVVALTLLAGCEARRDATPAPTAGRRALTPFATVRLRDRDTAYIAKANALAVSARGEFFVTDMLSRRILRFDPNGSFMETIGRQGGGPNEFEGTSRLTVLDDSTLAVIDVLRRQAILWSLPSRSATARLPLPGLTSSLTRANGSLYAAAPDVEHGTAGLRWRSAHGAPERLGAILDVYRGRLQSTWGTVAMDASGDSILFFGGRSEFLIIANGDWQPHDSLPIPRVARRGIPRELDTTLGNGRNIYDIGRQLSIPFGLRVLSGGRYAVFHLDADIQRDNTVRGEVFMTVLSSARPPRCIDVRVPTHDPTSIPRLAFAGDTLFVLDHFERADTLLAEVSKYHIAPHVC